MKEGLKREVGMLECVYYIRLENLLCSCIIHESPEDILFTQVKMNALVMGIPVLLRRLVIAVLGSLGLTVTDAVVELDFPLRIGIIKSQNNRGQVAFNFQKKVECIHCKGKQAQNGSQESYTYSCRDLWR